MQYAFVEDTKYRLQLKFGYLRIAKTRILDASTKNYNLDRNVRKLKFPYFEFLFISMNFQISKRSRFQKLCTLQYILNFKKIKIIVLDNLSFFVIQKNSYLILNSKKIKKQRTSFLISDKSFSATKNTSIQPVNSHHYPLAFHVSPRFFITDPLNETSRRE